MQSTLHLRPQLFLAAVSSSSKRTPRSKHVVFLSKNRRRNESQRLIKFVLEAVPLVASNLKILPPPLDLLIREFGGGVDGNGGGLGSGGGWKRFGGWGRGGRRKLGFWWVFVVFGLGLLVGSEIENHVLCGIVGVGFVGAALVEGWSKRAIRNGILGFCLFGALIAFGLRKELQSHARDFIRVRPPLMNNAWRRGRRKSRR